MSKDKARAQRAHVEIQRPGDGGEDEVSFFVKSPDGRPLTGNQILEAVAEAILLYWDNCPIEYRDLEEFDA